MLQNPVTDTGTCICMWPWYHEIINMVDLNILSCPTIFVRILKLRFDFAICYLKSANIFWLSSGKDYTIKWDSNPRDRRPVESRVQCVIHSATVARYQRKMFYWRLTCGWVGNASDFRAETSFVVGSNPTAGGTLLFSSILRFSKSRGGYVKLINWIYQSCHRH